MRPRSCAAVLHADAILMVCHRYGGREYWTLPGGGIEEGETSAQAAERELREETGLKGAAIRFLFEEPYLGDGITCQCWLVELMEEDQEAILGYDPEEDELDPDDRMLQDVAWMPLAEVADDGQVAQVLKALSDN